MHFLIKLCLLLFTLFVDQSLGIMIDEDSTFYPHRLERTIDCKEFNRSKHNLARMDGYFRPSMWYLDKDFQYSFEECTDAIGREDETIPLIFRIRNRFDYKDSKFIQSLEELGDRYHGGVILIPEVHVVLGPGGFLNDTAQNMVDLPGYVVASSAEREATNIAYSVDFFIEYKNRIQLLASTNKFLQFNGWHLKNMRPPPDPGLLATLYGQTTVIIIYVDARYSKRIGKNQMEKNLRNGGGSIPTILWDTHDSPKHLSSAIPLVWSTPLILLTCARGLISI